jgi:LPXTG-motif cell wall-anchored protein
VAALALVCPSAAFAQSAGDDQYRDPFAGQSPPSSGTGSRPSQGSPSTPAPSSQAQQSGAPQTGAAGQSAQTGAAQAAAGQSGNELPRTGSRTWLLALAGGLLLLAGALLRGAARPAPAAGAAAWPPPVIQPGRLRGRMRSR